MTIDKLIEELKEVQEKGYTEIEGMLFAENEERGIIMNVPLDSDWIYPKEVFK